MPAYASYIDLLSYLRGRGQYLISEKLQTRYCHIEVSLLWERKRHGLNWSLDELRLQGGNGEVASRALKCSS